MSDNIKILKNYILYFLVFIIVCIYGIIHASALTYESAEGYQNNITVVLVAPDYSNTPINVPINSQLAFNQVREVIVQVNSFNFVANRNYQLELFLPQQDLGRANFYTVQGANGESCLVSYDNSAFDGEYPRWAFQCPNSTNNITIDIKNSNNQILWDNGPNGAPIFTWGYSYLRYSSTSLSGSGIGTDDIINNQNQNTQNIINNQNQNTQDIINNQNQNTQQQIESQQVCNTYVITKDDVYLNNTILRANDITASSNGWGVTNYIDISDLVYFKVLSVYENSSTGANICFYTSSKSLVSCQTIGNLSGTLSIADNVKYFRSSILIGSNKPNYEYKICKNGNQALDDTLNDDDTSDAENEASDFFESFTTDTFGLTSIITAPLTLIQSVLSSTCTELQLPLPYLSNKYLTLPCMTSIYSQYFGTFFTIYQTITYGIIAYWVCVRIFNQVKDFKNPEHDEIEVMDL